MDEHNQDKSESNLINLEEEKSKRRPKKTIPKEVLHRAILDAMEHSVLSLLPDFPKNYITVAMPQGAKILAEVTPEDEVVYVDNTVASYAVMQYCHGLRGYNEKYCIDAAQSEKFVEAFIKLKAPIPVPKLVRFKSEHGLCMRRVPFDPIGGRVVGTPTWDRLLSRMTNADAFKAFIGSMFFDASHAHSYVWLYGPGGEGKSAIGRFLGRVFGRSFASIQGVYEKRFWKARLIDKRCVIFSDWSDHSFVTGNEFKSLAGGDSVSIEEKYKKTYDAFIPCKFIFLSNERPSISSESSDSRRLIYCTIGAPKIEEMEYGAFEEKLWKEGPAFIGDCLETYRRLCPDDKEIPTEDSAAKELVASNESEYDALFSYFKYRRPADRKNINIKDELSVTGKAMHEFETRMGLRSGRDRKKWHDWLNRVHGVHCIRVRTGSLWVGIWLSSSYMIAKEGDYND